MDSQTIFMVSIVGAFALVAYFVVRLVAGDNGVKALRNRLGDGGEARKAERNSTPDVSLLQRLGSAAAKPFMPETREKQSGLRKDARIRRLLPAVHHSHRRRI